MPDARYAVDCGIGYGDSGNASQRPYFVDPRVGVVLQDAIDQPVVAKPEIIDRCGVEGVHVGELDLLGMGARLCHSIAQLSC